MVKGDSSLQRTRFHCSSRCLELRMVILGLCAADRPWKPILWSASMSVLVLTLIPEVVSVVAKNRCATLFHTRRSRSVSLCGLPLCGWAVVAPRCFHFTITALTVDCGSSSRAEILQTDLLERWHTMTMPRWKLLSSSVRPFYSNVCLWRLNGCVLNLFTPFSNGCGWKLKPCIILSSKYVKHAIFVWNWFGLNQH